MHVRPNSPQEGGVFDATLPPPGTILASLRAVALPGRYLVLVCTPAHLVVKTVVPWTLGAVVPIIAGLLCFPLAIVAVAICVILQRRTAQACVQASQYAGQLRNATDEVIDLATVRRITSQPSWGQTRITISHPRGHLTLRLTAADARRLAACYPAHVTATGR